MEHHDERSIHLPHPAGAKKPREAVAPTYKRAAIELRRLTGGASVVARPGRIEIEGDRCREVKAWLMSLGL